VDKQVAKVRASELALLSFQIDDAELRAKIARLSDERLTKEIYMPVLLATLKTLQRRSTAAAAAAGFAATGPMESDTGWKWTRKARVFNSIKVGKRWRVKGYTAGRVYTAQGKRNEYLKRAPHANPKIAGHIQVVPTGIPGKGQVRPTGKVQPPRPIFSVAKAGAQKILTDTLKRAIRKFKV
jgi:hypothetical protein